MHPLLLSLFLFLSYPQLSLCFHFTHRSLSLYPCSLCPEGAQLPPSRSPQEPELCPPASIRELVTTGPIGDPLGEGGSLSATPPSEGENCPRSPPPLLAALIFLVISSPPPLSITVREEVMQGRTLCFLPVCSASHPQAHSSYPRRGLISSPRDEGCIISHCWEGEEGAGIFPCLQQLHTAFSSLHTYFCSWGIE